MGCAGGMELGTGAETGVNKALCFQFVIALGVDGGALALVIGAVGAAAAAALVPDKAQPAQILFQCIGILAGAALGIQILNAQNDAPALTSGAEPGQQAAGVVMSHFIPDYIWLATGGKNGCFNSEAMQVLKGREVTLIPDLGATEQWKEKSALLAGICKRVVVSNVLECTSDEEQRSQGLDIADFFLYSPSKRQILRQMIQRNPALQLLIDEFDLELIE